MVIEVIQELWVEGGGRAVRVAISQTIIEGWTPLVIAAHHGWTAVCQILCDEFDAAAAAEEEHGKAADGEPRNAQQKRRASRELLEYRAIERDRLPSGCAFHMACKAGHVRTARWLLHHHAILAGDSSADEDGAYVRLRVLRADNGSYDTPLSAAFALGSQNELRTEFRNAMVALATAAASSSTSAEAASNDGGEAMARMRRLHNLLPERGLASALALAHYHCAWAWLLIEGAVNTESADENNAEPLSFGETAPPLLQPMGAARPAARGIHEYGGAGHGNVAIFGPVLQQSTTPGEDYCTSRAPYRRRWEQNGGTFLDQEKETKHEYRILRTLQRRCGLVTAWAAAVGEAWHHCVCAVLPAIRSASPRVVSSVDAHIGF